MLFDHTGKVLGVVESIKPDGSAVLATSGFVTITASSFSPDAPDIGAKPDSLVPIVLGGPWNGLMPGAWERWIGGLFAGYSTAPYTGIGHRRVKADVPEYDADEIHAPEGWTPTPDTIPEGCYIQTPSDGERLHRTCTWYERDSVVCEANGCGMGTITPEGECYVKWCPTAD